MQIVAFLTDAILNIHATGLQCRFFFNLKIAKHGMNVYIFSNV